MTTPDLVERLRGLIERLEKLEGPDRELDAQVLCTLLAPLGSKVAQSPFNGAWIIYAPRIHGPRQFARWEKPRPWRLDHEALTASLDAAVALVERVLPGWTGIVDFGGPTKCTATLVGPLREIGEDFDGAPVEIRDDAGGEGSTPAIALLIATLKALSQEPSK